MIRLTCTLAFACLCATPALAQDFSMMSNWAQGQMLNDNLQRNLNNATARRPTPRSRTPISRRGASASASTVGAVGPVRTTYRSDPAVTVRVRRQFVDFIRHTDGQAGAAALQQAFARTDPLQHWARAVAEDGMRLGDLGDAMTEYWVQNWMMANGVDHAPPARVRAVRAQVQSLISTSPALARLDEAQRQEMAESLIYNEEVQGEVYASALRSHDQALQARLSDAAETRMRNEMHVEARRLALTETGFTARAEG